MRNHRRALIDLSLVAASAVIVIFGVSQTGSPVRNHQWKSFATQGTPLRTPLLTTASLQPLAVFAQRVEASTSTTTTSVISRSVTLSTVATVATPASGEHADYSLDATTTATPDWACIRLHEDGGTYDQHESGAYGFEPSTASAYFGTTDAQGVAPASQDAAALDLFHRNGDHFLGTWNGSPEACGLR